MKRMLISALVLMSFVGVVSAQDAVTMPSTDEVVLTRVAEGFTRPLLLTHAGDGSNRIFVAQQGGKVLILDEVGSTLEMPFLDLTALVSPAANNLAGYSEQGLLGLAFDPAYTENGYFYVNYTDVGGDTVVARYSVSDDPNVADPTSAVVLLTQEQPYQNHNGGYMAFGPDGYLYIGMGDGGSAGDPQNNAQNMQSSLGKMLRVDVSTGEVTVPETNPFVSQADALPEIWAYGLRNPWRFSFDRETGDLYIADVGQNQYEEVNFQPASSVGGENYGWVIREGFHSYTGAPLPEGATDPILEYDHSQGASITGGFVYRGENIPALDGVYIYGDFGSGRIWFAVPDAQGVWSSVVYPTSAWYGISSFGEDEAGEVYLVDYTGVIYRFDPSA